MTGVLLGQRRGRRGRKNESHVTSRTDDLTKSATAGRRNHETTLHRTGGGRNDAVSWMVIHAMSSMMVGGQKAPKLEGTLIQDTIR